MSRALKNQGHRDSNRDAWGLGNEDLDRGRGRDRQPRSVSRHRRRASPPPPRRSRPGGDRDSYRSPVRRAREFDKPALSSRRRSRGRSKSIESRRSTHYESISPRRSSRNEKTNGRHGSPEARHSSHRHKRRHPSATPPPKRKRSRSPGHGSHKHSSRKSRRPRSSSRSRSPVRRSRRDISLSPRHRSPSSKKYSHRPPTRGSDHNRDRSVSRSSHRRSNSSFRHRSPLPRTRRLSPPQPRRQSPPHSLRRHSPPPIGSRYSSPNSRRHSPPPPPSRDKRSNRRYSRSRSPIRGITPPPPKRAGTPLNSPPRSSRPSSKHKARSPPPLTKRRSPTPPSRSARIISVGSSETHASDRSGDKDHRIEEPRIISEVKSNGLSPRNIQTPPRRIVSILDQQQTPESSSRQDAIDGSSQETNGNLDSHGRQQEFNDSDRFAHSESRFNGNSGPYINPERSRNINGSGGPHSRGRGWSQDPHYKGQSTQPTHSNYPHGQYRGNSYTPQGNRHGPSNSAPYYSHYSSNAPHHQQQQPPYPPHRSSSSQNGPRHNQFSPGERSQGYDRNEGYASGPPHQQGMGRNSSAFNNGPIGREGGRGRFSRYEQHTAPAPPQQSHTERTSPDDNPYRPTALYRVKDEFEDQRKDSGSDEMSLATSSLDSNPQDQKPQNNEMPPPSRPTSKGSPQSQPAPLGPFKRVTQTTVIRPSSQADKGSTFRPFQFNIRSSRVNPKTAMVPKALEGSRDNGKPPASGGNSIPLGKTAAAHKISAKSRSPGPEIKMSSVPPPKSKEVEKAPATEKTVTAPTPPTPAQTTPQVPIKEISIYNRLSMVGEGTYGKVYKARNNVTKELVALKRIRMESEKDGFPITAVREMRLLQALKQENVVSLLEMMVEKSDFYMVFEYMDHDLTGILNHPTFRLEPCHIKHLAKQFFEGLEYLHHRGVLHRDIKGSNILLNNEGQLKIADFGLARFYTKASKRQLDYTNRIITLWYRPPEILLGATAYGPSVDMWSAACVFVELFTRTPVFPGKSEIDQLDTIYNIMGTPSEKVWSGLKGMPWYNLLWTPGRQRPKFEKKYEPLLPPSALDLVVKLLQYDPDKRPSAEECLKHAYFSEDPASAPPLGLRDLKGDWHEYESKAQRRKDREQERKRRESYEAEKRKAKEAERKKQYQLYQQQKQAQQQPQEYDPEKPPIAASGSASKRKREDEEGNPKKREK